MMAIKFLQHISVILFAVSSSDKNTEKQDQSKLFSKQQMSWQELGEILVAAKDENVEDETLLSTRLRLPRLNRVRVGPSQVGAGAGRGVFATQDCKEGDLLTCFPGDVLFSQSGFRPNPKDVGIDNDDVLRDLLSRYCIGVTEEYGILGLPDLDQDVAYVGHLINDGIAKLPVNENELIEYESKSQALANAEHLPLENLHMVTIATRDIAKDEEIFVYYGPVYWMEHKSTWQGKTYD